MECQPMPCDDKKFKRLPKNVVPSHYNIRLKPDLENFTFEGEEDINIEIVIPTQYIKMNVVDVEVESAIYTPDGNEKDHTKATIITSQQEEELLLDFPCLIPAGKGTLYLKFNGELNDKMKGFYRSRYTVDGEERYAAVTQFEATDARRCFPCWDEPAIKATFDVTLTVPRNRVALSNMPIISEKDLNEGRHGSEENSRSVSRSQSRNQSQVSLGSGLKVVTYETTPIMSTYLLAFVVGEFDMVEATDSNGVIVRVFTPLNKSEQGKFALDVAVRTLPFYKDYFGIAYPLPKVDLIAIPDFSAGAMENWGLITYRETALLVDPENSSARIKQWVALVVGHELAHQWFGNLVTMKENWCKISDTAKLHVQCRDSAMLYNALGQPEWWTHLWLNEGFASWIEYLCVDFCFPEFDVWTQFVNNDLGQALEMDALVNSHPIEVEVGHPSEVDEIFDAISYSKGSSVIRMLNDYLGDEDFRRGMNIYLTRHQYKNTSTEHLWAALEEASGKPVARMMETWTKQKGFPVLKVEEEQCGKDRHLKVTQAKFTAGGKAPPKGYRWMIPVTAITQPSPECPMLLGLMECNRKDFVLHFVAEGQWVKLNAGTVGFYRVMYPSHMLCAMMPAIRDLSMPAKDRLGLQSDLFALSRAGLTSSTDLLRMVEAYKNETDFTVWTNLASNLNNIGTILQYSGCYPGFKVYMLRLFQIISGKVGWDVQPDEGTLAPLLREVVLTRMGRYGDEATIKEAKKRFEDHVSGEKKLSADLKSTVYYIVLANGDSDTFDKMMQLYDDANMQEEKVRIARALGSVQDKDLLNKVLFFSMSDKVRAQDAVFVISGCCGTKEGNELAWKFFKDNFNTLSERYEGGFLLSRLVQACTENFATEEMALEVELFFKEHPLDAAERTIKQSIENIRLNAQWLEREEVNVCKYVPHVEES